MTLREAIIQRQPGVYECPIHQSRSRRTVKYKVGDDGRGLLHDFGGCKTGEILEALNLQWSDLFPDQDPVRRRELAQQKGALDGFRQWREFALCAAAKNLRERDQVRLAINDSVKSGALTEAAALDVLASIYSGYSQLEEDFEVLRTGTDLEALEVYRRG